MSNNPHQAMIDAANTLWEAQACATPAELATKKEDAYYAMMATGTVHGKVLLWEADDAKKLANTQKAANTALYVEGMLSATWALRDASQKLFDALIHPAPDEDDVPAHLSGTAKKQDLRKYVARIFNPMYAREHEAGADALAKEMVAEFVARAKTSKAHLDSIGDGQERAAAEKEALAAAFDTMVPQFPPAFVSGILAHEPVDKDTAAVPAKPNKTVAQGGVLHGRTDSQVIAIQ